jgi:supervillin
LLNYLLLFFLYIKKTNLFLIDKDCGFTETALAGLASKEDFSNIKLKRSDSTTHNTEYPPFNDLMLIQIKGNK